MADIRAHLLVSGRVQGVFFRYATQEEATRLGLTGSVRNLKNGGVEIIAEGEESIVEGLIRWSRQGPPGAQVREVQVEQEPATGEFSRFVITY